MQSDSGKPTTDSRIVAVKVEVCWAGIKAYIKPQDPELAEEYIRAVLRGTQFELMDALDLTPKEFRNLEIGGYLLRKMRRDDFLIWEREGNPMGLSVIKELTDAGKGG